MLQEAGMAGIRDSQYQGNTAYVANTRIGSEDQCHENNVNDTFRLFHVPTRTTSGGCFMLHRTVHALWNLYGNPYKNRAEKREETVT